ncbi:hypothetical protein H5410_050524 [Solanum commersonii]|uniref:Uncharacterized protein n=1 Tax=Solanum commersonii TaxID=4109 RepID=A0A9J5WVP5_SOLCO|nr:hypothetical protein H5410_050524 [Solanum commersonii]
MDLLASNLGCQITTLPTRYLGMPLGAQNKDIGVWNDVLKRCDKKLARWKSHYLSLGGRLTLVKENRGYKLVKWDIVTLSRKHGELDMKKLSPRTPAFYRNGFGDSALKSYHYGIDSSLTNMDYKVISLLRRKIDFSNDLWIGEECLATLFPNLVILSQRNKDTISQMWRPQG